MGLWKEIRKEGSLMLKNIAFSMGRFWKDMVREQYPS